MDAFIILFAATFFSLIAVAFGVDSREESNDPHRQVYPVGLG